MRRETCAFQPEIHVVERTATIQMRQVIMLEVGSRAVADTYVVKRQRTR